jgi:hypothetical protein
LPGLLAQGAHLALPAAEQYRACNLLCEAGMAAEQMKLALLQHS